MLKHSYPVVNSVIRNERHPTNSGSTIYVFNAFTRDKPLSEHRILKRQMSEAQGDVNITMQLTKCMKANSSVTPYKYYTRCQMCLSTFSALYPGGVPRESDEKCGLPMGAFVLHKKAMWRKSYVSVSDLTADKDSMSHKVCCYIERLDHTECNIAVHEQANFLIETLKAHPVSAKYLQGLAVYKNTQTGDESLHFPDIIIEFAIAPKSGKYFSALLRDYCLECKTANITFGIYKRKQILTSAAWV